MNALMGYAALVASWSSLWHDLDSGQRFALLVVAIGCGTGVICTIVVFVSSTISSIHARRLDAHMKREMIDRGMSADEIKKVIEASSPAEDAH